VQDTNARLLVNRFRSVVRAVVPMQQFSEREFNVKVEGDRIVVRLPGTTFRTTYFRIASGLAEAKFMSVDRSATISAADFESLAWEAAKQKARELGWTI
jgi:hypothetical protein